MAAGLFKPVVFSAINFVDTFGMIVYNYTSRAIFEIMIRR